MARKDSLMKKIIYLIFVLTITSTLQAEEGILVNIADGDTLYFETDNKTNKCKIAYIDSPESTYNNKLQRDQTCIQ